MALDWGNIDWLSEEVMVSRAMTQAAKGQAEATKTAAGRSSVKLLRPATEALKLRRPTHSLQMLKYFKTPERRNDGLVMPQSAKQCGYRR